MISNTLQIQKFISLANYTTWRIGGPAEWLAEPSNIRELNDLITWSNNQNIACNIIGAGSNLLIDDTGVKGLIICMRKMHVLHINKVTGSIEVFAGESMPNLARRAAKEGLHGLEWSVGIPGTVGGAVTMNAGAQGGCTADWLDSIKVMTKNGKKVLRLSKDQLNYGYRSSFIQKETLIVISARFQLEPGHEAKLIHQTTQDNLLHRINSQPYQLPSCGSVFRNPEPLKAGKLIESLGLKGYRIGGAEISNRHSNFIVNVGDASASDMTKMIKHIQKKVKEKYGLLLKPEVKQLGFDLND